MSSPFMKIIEKIRNKSFVNMFIMSKDIEYFDVTLRDGLQSIKTCYPLSKKKKCYMK